MSARNMLLIAPAQAAQVLVGVGSVVLFTRLMEPDSFGLYALILSASMLAHTLLFTWAEAAAFRFLAEAQRDRSEADHFATILAIALAIAIVCAAVMGVAMIFAPTFGAAAIAVALSGALSAARFLTKVARETDRAELAMARYAWRETAFIAGGFLVAIALLLWTQAGLLAPFVGAVAAGALIAALDLPKLIASSRGGRVGADRVLRYAAYGAPLAAGLAIDLVMQTSTRAALVFLESEAAAGAFAAAQGVIGRAIDVLFIWTALAFAPPLLRAYEAGDHASIRAASADLTRALAVVTIPATVGIALVAEPLCALLVGEALAREATQLAPFIAASALASGFAVYLASEAFVLRKKTTLRLLLLLPAALVHIALLVFCVQHWGLLGAGVATVVSSVAAFGLLFGVGMRLAPITAPAGDMGRIAIACTVMACAVVSMPASGGWIELLAKTSVGASVYVLVILALNVGGVMTWLRSKFARAAT